MIVMSPSEPGLVEPVPIQAEIVSAVAIDKVALEREMDGIRSAEARKEKVLRQKLDLALRKRNEAIQKRKDEEKRLQEIKKRKKELERLREVYERIDAELKAQDEAIVKKQMAKDEAEEKARQKKNAEEAKKKPKPTKKKTPANPHRKGRGLSIKRK